MEGKRLDELTDEDFDYIDDFWFDFVENVGVNDEFKRFNKFYNVEDVEMNEEIKRYVRDKVDVMSVNWFSNMELELMIIGDYRDYIKLVREVGGFVIVRRGDKYGFVVNKKKWIKRCMKVCGVEVVEVEQMVNVVDVGFEEFEEMKEVCEWYREVRDGREDVVGGYVEMVEMRMSDEMLWCVRRKDGWRISRMGRR